MSNDQKALGKVVLVTGGSRGIGAGIAKRFAAEGYRVAIAYRSGKAEADTVLGEIVAAGGQGIVVGGDIAKAEDAQAMVAQVVAKFGAVDVLVNCARRLPSTGRSKRPMPLCFMRPSTPTSTAR